MVVSALKDTLKKNHQLYMGLKKERFMAERGLAGVLSVVSSFFPVKGNRVLCRAYEGKNYSCNPKYISEALLSKYGKNKFEIIWCLKDTDRPDLLAKGYKLVKFKSIKYYYYFMTSKVVIFNDLFHPFINRRPEQLLINTWHGGGAYKKCGVSTLTEQVDIDRYTAMHDATRYISSCKYFTNVSTECFNNSVNDYLDYGMPRNDIFFKDNDFKEQIIDALRKKFKLSQDFKYVLYAPTYRLSQENSTYNLDFAMLTESLTKRFGSKWKVLFRGHYYLSDNHMFKNSEIVNVSEYEDMQHILLLADVLITDYSSSVWDFSLQLKPCFLYATDLEEYKKDVDFYIPIEQWPYSLARNNDELSKNIMNFDAVKYTNAVKMHQKDLGTFEDGNATERICNLIETFCK